MDRLTRSELNSPDECASTRYREYSRMDGFSPIRLVSWVKTDCSGCALQPR